MKILLTGAAGFIGSAVYRHLRDHSDHEIVALDNLSYSAGYREIVTARDGGRTRFEPVDIRQEAELERVFREHRPDAVMHLAAESHVDRSIDGPKVFITTNVLGTYTLLEAARRYWSDLGEAERSRFRFLHVSTDEVYGTLGPSGKFTEETPYAPNSPYSASKAASDHLVRAWHETYGLPVLMTNCSNNYGPYQFPEKLIPLMIINGLEGRPLPVYGDGRSVRDWLHVEDRAEALALVLPRGRVGEKYNGGGDAERTNLEVVEAVCDLLDERLPDPSGPRRRLITFVRDRPGHDRRYAIDFSKIERELGWRPRRGFERGLAETIDWFAANRDWWGAIRAGSYAGERLGTLALR